MLEKDGQLTESLSDRTEKEELEGKKRRRGKGLETDQKCDEELESVGEWWRVCSQIVLKCVYLARIGGPWHSLVGEQTCWISHAMNRSMRQTFRSFVFIHSSHKWLPTMLVTRFSIVDWVYSKTQILLVTMRIQNPLRRNLMYLWKSNICCYLLDSAESEIFSLDAGLRIDGLLALDLWDCGERSVAVEQYQTTNQSRSRKLFAKSQIQHQTKGTPKCGAIIACGLRHHKRTLFSRWVSVVHLWRQCSSDQNDHQGQKSNSETRVKNPQSCAWLVIRQNQFGHQDLNQTFWHQKPTRRHVNQIELHTWWVGPSSSFVEQQDFFVIFLQPSSFKQKAECHVQESSRKYSERECRQWRNRDQWVWC